MKIAVASMGTTVAEHFGHCETFWVFNMDGEIVKSEEKVANPGHKPGFLPNFLADLDVNVIISGGMGGGAVDIFNERGLDVVTGARGNAKEAAINFVNGSLISSGSICHEHSHADECQ